MEERSDVLSINAELLINRQELGEILYTHDRNLLSNWLSEQRLEGHAISMSLAEYIWSAAQEMKRLELRDQIDRMMSLQAKLLGLPLKDFADKEQDAKRSLGDALRCTDTLELLFSHQKWFTVLMSKIKKKSAPASPTTILWLQHQRYKKSDEHYVINPGRIGPNFVHTWALDLVNVQAFRFAFPWSKFGNEIAMYNSQKWGDDKLTVIDSCNRVLQTFTSLYDLHTKIIDLQNLPPCKYDAQHQPYTRIYIILETSRDPLPGASRMFKIAALEHLTPLTGNERVYVVADEINYDYFDTSIQPQNNNDFVEALDAHGKPIQIYPPWAGGPQGAYNNLAAQFKTKPSADKGWYLLGLNTKYVDQKFYSVVYYNERKALLRIYLYNLDEVTVQTAHVVKVSLEGCLELVKEPNHDPEIQPKLSGVYKPLNGAFFPLDPDSKKWGCAELVVSGWQPYTWTAVDVPVLYPMGSNLPAIGDYVVGSVYLPGNNPTSKVGAKDFNCQQPYRKVQRYRSVYEDEFGLHQKNVSLVVAVRSFHLGYADFDIVAKAVGEAVQKMPSGGFEKLFDAIKTGKDWYSYASDFGKIMTSSLEKQVKSATGAAKVTAQEMMDKMSTSFTVIGAVAAMAGALLKLIGVLSNDALTLAITLAIHGKITGTINFQDVERKNRFYLPGRFSMIDAFSVDGIASDNWAYIDSLLPRYDRTIGLFGYAYQPWDVEVNLDAGLRLGQPIRNGKPLDYTEDAFFFPARQEVLAIQGDRGTAPYYEYKKRLLPDLLPVVTNPRAEIDVIPAKWNQSCEYVVSSYRFVDGYPYDERIRVPCSEIYLIGSDRADVKAFHTKWKWGLYKGWPYLVEQLRDSQTPYPPLRINVIELKLPQPETSILPFEPIRYLDRRGVDVDMYYYVKYGLGHTESLNWNASAPMLLSDVLYYWKLTYLYWGDTRVPPGNAYPKVEEAILGTPITMRVMTEEASAKADKQVESSLLG